MLTYAYVCCRQMQRRRHLLYVPHKLCLASVNWHRQGVINGRVRTGNSTGGGSMLTYADTYADVC
jgi:hypothetical protein